MIKIKVLNPTEDRNEPTFRVLMGCRDILKTYSIDVTTTSDDYDYLFVGMHDFINKKIPLQDSIDWGLENLEKVTEGGEYFLFDGSDSTSLMGSYEVLEQCDAIYLFKNQLLQREYYKNPMNFGRWFWESGELDLGYDIKDKDWDRIKLSGWNLGHLNPTLIEKMPSINPYKPHDVCAIYQGEHKENYEHGIRNDIPYTEHRKGAWEILDEKFESRTEKLPPEEYIHYLYESKVCLSPFGMGEVCFRDFESINVGTIMIKPDMGMVLTEPNIYIDKETYFAVNYDWSNLNEVIDEVLSDFDRINREVIDNARRKFVNGYRYEDYCFHLYNIFSDLSNITIGGSNE
jgi:hypothetical protein